jgi:hypothetical protein
VKKETKATMVQSRYLQLPNINEEISDEMDDIDTMLPDPT